jgi:hypothetical protein
MPNNLQLEKENQGKPNFRRYYRVEKAYVVWITEGAGNAQFPHKSIGYVHSAEDTESTNENNLIGIIEPDDWHKEKYQYE